MKKSNKILVSTLIISGLSVVISYLINFFLTPFITDTVGTAAYGYVTLAKNAVSYVTIITVAFTAFIVRYITLAYHKENYEESRAYFSSSVAAVITIAIIVISIAFVAIVFLEKLIVIPFELIRSVKVLFLLVFLHFCIYLILIPYTSSCYIKNKLTFFNSVKIISHIIEMIILVIMFKFLHTEIWYVGVGMVVSALVVFVGNYILFKKLTPELYFDKSIVSINKVKNLARNGIWQSVNSFGLALNTGLDLLITNLMLTPLSMGQLSIAKTIGLMFSTLNSTVSQAFQPRMLKTYASDDKNVFLKELKLAMRVSGFFSACAFAGFLVLGKLYYQLWIPNQDYDLIYKLTVITVLNSVTEGVVYPTYYVNTLTTKKKIPCFITVGMGIINVIGMYFLIKYTTLGVFAVVWTTAVLTIVNTMIFNTIYCPVTLKLPWYTLYPVVIRHLVASVALCLAFFGVSKIINPLGWIGLIFSALLCVCVGIAVYVIIVSNGSERKKIRNYILRKVRY